MGSRRTTWSLLGALSVLAVVQPARAESALSCVSLEIVEVFVGAEGCPSADYVVLEVVSGGGGWIFPVDVRDKCLQPKGTFGGLAILPPAAKQVLIATPAAQALFGVKADVEASLDLLGGDELKSECYGWSSNVPLGPIPPGKALKHTTSGWVLSEPSPVNAAGETGSLGVCPADASVPDSAADAADADVDAEPPCSGGTTGGGGTIGSGGSSGGAPGGGGAGGASAGGTTGDASATGGSDAAAGGSPITDAGPGASSGSEAGGDCACRTPAERPPWPRAWLLVGAALSVAWRWRRSSVLP